MIKSDAACSGLRVSATDQSPGPSTPNMVAVIPEIFAEIPLPVEWTLYVKPIHDLHDFTVFQGGFGLAGGEPVSVDS